MTARTADQIASLFARGRRQGAWPLTRKQTDWLATIAQREADRAGCRTVQRRHAGYIPDDAGQPAGVFWSLDIYPNGAGLFRLTDIEAQRQAEQAQAEKDRAIHTAQLAAMDRAIDERLAHPDDRAEYLNIRNEYARLNGLDERP